MTLLSQTPFARLSRGYFPRPSSPFALFSRGWTGGEVVLPEYTGDELSHTILGEQLDAVSIDALLVANIVSEHLVVLGLGMVLEAANIDSTLIAVCADTTLAIEVLDEWPSVIVIESELTTTVLEHDDLEADVLGDDLSYTPLEKP